MATLHYLLTYVLPCEFFYATADFLNLVGYLIYNNLYLASIKEITIILLTS